MKKVVRLTESDLTRIIKRVIEEQSDTKLTPEEIKSLDMFLSYMNPKGKNGTWKQPNSISSSVVVKLQPNARITNLGGFDIKKPLSWEFYKDGKKLEYGEFEIYKSQGVLFYRVVYTPKLVQKSEKFIGNEKKALEIVKKTIQQNCLPT
jgi:hypothetical protein